MSTNKSEESGSRTQKGYRVPATVRSERSVCGLEATAFIVAADGEDEAVETVMSKGGVEDVDRLEIENLVLDEEGLRVPEVRHVEM